MFRAIRHLLTALLVLAAVVSAAPCADARAPVFHSEAQAKEHCPKDTVVWLNTKSGVYHFKGQRWYGRTKSGAYACKREVDQDGTGRATKNGQ